MSLDEPTTTAEFIAHHQRQIRRLEEIQDYTYVPDSSNILADAIAEHQQIIFELRKGRQ